MTTSPRESSSVEPDLRRVLKRFWPLIALAVSACLFLFIHYADTLIRQQHETLVREGMPADAVVEEYLGSEQFRLSRHGSFQVRYRYVLRFDGHRGFAYSMNEYPIGHKLKVRYLPNDTRGYHVSRDNLELVEEPR